MVALGSLWGTLWALLGRPGPPFGRSWGVMGPLGTLLGLSVGALGPLLAPSLPTLGVPGRISCPPGPLGVPPGCSGLFFNDFHMIFQPKLHCQNLSLRPLLWANARTSVVLPPCSFPPARAAAVRSTLNIYIYIYIYTSVILSISIDNGELRSRSSVGIGSCFGRT